MAIYFGHPVATIPALEPINAPFPPNPTPSDNAHHKGLMARLPNTAAYRFGIVDGKYERNHRSSKWNIVHKCTCYCRNPDNHKEQ